MRKMFRMKYESCTGQCYAPEDVMNVHNLGLTVEVAAKFLHRLLEAHDPMCGNSNLSYSLDVDEDLEIFVASFQRYGYLDLFCGKTPMEAMDKLIDASLKYYESDEYKKLSEEKPGLGHDVCEHGKDKDLLNFAITFSGLNDSEQQELRTEVGL